jgi:hypothetical protein
VLQTWFKANSAHAAEILLFQLFRQPPLRQRWWDWHFRSTLCTQDKVLHIQTTHTYPRDATSVAEVAWGPITCSSNSTVPIVPPPPPCVLRWDWHLRSTLHHKTRLSHPNYPHPIPGTHPVSADVVPGPIRHMQLKFYRFTCSATTTIKLRLLASTLWYHTRGFHIQTTHTYSRDATSVADVVGAWHMQLKFY